MRKVSGYAQVIPAQTPPQNTRVLRGIWNDFGLDAVESMMVNACTAGTFDRMGVITSEHLATGGKRLRARLALGATEALGGDREGAVAWAASCELLHNATLLHDDVQDGDRVRRGRAAVWVRHGVSQAINAGDLMLMLPYSVLDHLDTSDATKWALTRVLATNAELIVRGQAGELDLLSHDRLDWDNYATSTQGKTAALFGMPVEGAALLAGHSREAADELAEPFRRIGLLFQIQDDVLDLFGDKGRDVIGSDLYEGKVSALVSEHIRLYPSDRVRLTSLLKTPRDRTNADDVAATIQSFRDGGALAAVWERMAAIEREVDEWEALRACPRLHSVAMTLVAKAVAPIAHTAPVDRLVPSKEI